MEMGSVSHKVKQLMERHQNLISHQASPLEKVLEKEHRSKSIKLRSGTYRGVLTCLMLKSSGL